MEIEARRRDSEGEGRCAAQFPLKPVTKRYMRWRGLSHYRCRQNCVPACDVAGGVFEVARAEVGDRLNRGVVGCRQLLTPHGRRYPRERSLAGASGGLLGG